jgi:hypothetical protein
LQGGLFFSLMVICVNNKPIALDRIEERQVTVRMVYYEGVIRKTYGQRQTGE